MSTLTKICVVVLVVLLLFACPVFIQQAVTGPNWKQACLNEQARREQADMSARNNMLAAQVWQRLYEDARTSAGNDARQFMTIISSKDIEISRLTGLLADRSARMNDLSAALKASEQNLKGQIGLNETLSKQLKSEQGKNIALSDQLRRAQDSIKEYLANIEILTKSVRVLKEQVAQRESEIADLQAQLAAGGVTTAAKPAPKAAVKIEATITAVKGDVASLNIGSASGVKKGMEFIIYRGADFVAHLRIADVGVSSSAGIIMDATRAVRVNDKATTSLE